MASLGLVQIRTLVSKATDSSNRVIMGGKLRGRVSSTVLIGSFSLKLSEVFIFSTCAFILILLLIFDNLSICCIEL